MRIFKIQLPMVLLVELALLFVGCSSSQQTAAPETTAQRSTNAVSTDPQVNAILEQSCYQCHLTRRRRTLVRVRFTDVPSGQLGAGGTEFFRLANL